MRNNVLIYLDKDLEPLLGSDGTFITELKTVRGIRNRLKIDMKNKAKRGYIHYVIMPYHTWKNQYHSTVELIKDIKKGKYIIYTTFIEI